MYSKARTALGVLALAGFGLYSSAASADLIGTFEGNDCPGVFGQPFDDCAIPANIDPDQTPIIIKFDFNDSGATTETEVNSAFPSITGDEFSFNFSTMTWTYTPGADDPLINYFVAKGGPSFNLFSNLGDPNSDVWSTPNNPANNQPFGLSHLSFYDTEAGGEIPGPKVPEPAPMLLLGAGLLAFGLARRRGKRD